MMRDDAEMHDGTKTAYLVRMKPNESFPREIVGIVVADGVNEVIRIIDEVCDVDMCEYMILPSGGVLAHGRAHVVPTPPAVVEADNFTPLAGLDLSESWESQVYDRVSRDTRWRTLVPSAQND